MRMINPKTSLLIASVAVAAGWLAGGDRRGTAAPMTPSAPVPEPEPVAMPARRRRPPRKLLIAAVAGAIVATAGIAIAAWTVTGSGSGYAKAASATAITLGDASASTTADLYPGATGTVKISITNPNSFPVRITTVTGNGAITSDKGVACNAATGVTFTNQTGLTLDLAGGATTTFTLSGAVAMSNSSDNSCQGAIFTIPVSVSGTSNA